MTTRKCRVVDIHIKGVMKVEYPFDAVITWCDKIRIEHEELKEEINELKEEINELKERKEQMDYEFRAETLPEAIKEVFREYYQNYDNTKMSILSNGYGTAITISVDDIDVAFITLKERR